MIFLDFFLLETFLSVSLIDDTRGNKTDNDTFTNSLHEKNYC